MRAQHSTTRETERLIRFPDTQWSLVLAAADRDGKGADEALAELCRAYWFPLYVYIRSRGFNEADAKDRTQDFFLFVLEHEVVARADPERGRFRGFLLAVLKNFLADGWDHSRARKRGGAHIHLPWEELETYGEHSSVTCTSRPADACFDAAWASTLAARALSGVCHLYEARKQRQVFDVLGAFLTGASPPHYRAAAHRLGLSESAVTSALYRLRREYRSELRRVVAQTLNDVADVDDEMRYLHAALASRVQ